MAEKKVIEIEAKTGQAKAELEKLTKEVESLNTELDKTGKTIKEETKKGEKGFKRLKTAARATANGIKKIGTAIKATGIGLLVAAIAAVGNALTQNQKAMDFFNTTLGFINIAVNDFVKFVENNFGTVVDYFNKVFKDPVQSLKDFGNAIKQNLIDRFNEYIETLGYVAKGVKQLFSGEFSEAMDTFKEAGKQAVDVFTGVDGTVDKVGEAVSKAVEATKEYVSENIKLAKTQVELKNNAQIAAALQEEALMKFRKQAEDQRQIRDDESKSINERIAANEEIVKILEKQKKEQISFAQEQLRAAETALKGNEDNVELNVALIQARTNLLSIEEDINGQLSEQKSNLNGLRRETEELNDIKTQGENDLQALREQFAADQATNPIEKLKLEEIARENAFEREKQRLIEIRDAHAVGTLARQQAESDLALLEENNRQASLKSEKLLTDQKVALAGQTATDIANLLGDQTEAGKAAAAAAALINTYQGISNVWAEKSESGLVGAGLVQRIATTAIVAAQGFKTVKDILKVNPKSVSGGVSVSSGAGGQVAQAPQFNLVGSSGTNQLASAIGSQTQQPVKAYVVSSEVTTQQAMDRQISDTASLGGD